MVCLFVIGCLAWWAHSFTTNNVQTQLATQKVYFPVAGSTALTSLPAVDQAQVSKYAGQEVLNGPQAKVFADNYIAVHLGKVAGGQTYSQVSTESLANPTNVTLQNEANTLFKGETLRGLLLGDAYAFWTIGYIAQMVAYVAFAAGTAMLILVLISLGHLRRL
jgi:hypothetical protein